MQSLQEATCMHAALSSPQQHVHGAAIGQAALTRYWESVTSTNSWSNTAWAMKSGASLPTRGGCRPEVGDEGMTGKTNTVQATAVPPGSMAYGAAHVMQQVKLPVMHRSERSALTCTYISAKQGLQHKRSQ